MIDSLISGLRNFRATFVCGSSLFCCLYLLFSSRVNISIINNSSLDKLVKTLYPYVNYALLAMIAYFIGVTYLTGLETVIHKLHKKNIMAKVNRKRYFIFGEILGLFAPYSEKSVKRVNVKVSSVIRDNNIECDINETVLGVLNDLLWIEGRIIGSKLHEHFIQIYSDAEFRVGFSLILTPLAFSFFNSILINAFLKVILLFLIGSASIMILIQGLYYYRKAYSMLAHYVADGELTTPTLISLNN